MLISPASQAASDRPANRGIWSIRSDVRRCTCGGCDKYLWGRKWGDWPAPCGYASLCHPINTKFWGMNIQKGDWSKVVVLFRGGATPCSEYCQSEHPQLPASLTWEKNGRPMVGHGRASFWMWMACELFEAGHVLTLGTEDFLGPWCQDDQLWRFPVRVLVLLAAFRFRGDTNKCKVLRPWVLSCGLSCGFSSSLSAGCSFSTVIRSSRLISQTIP